MICPIDHAELVISERQGIEIDYCPECRGVWLDRGELDKLIERGSAFGPAAPRPEHREAPRQEYREEPRRHYGDDDDKHYGHGDRKHHKKESFLGDIFDF